VARWLNTVPADFDGGPGLYTYVGNRPTNAVDPSGLQPPGPDPSYPNDPDYVITSAIQAIRDTPGYGVMADNIQDLYQQGRLVDWSPTGSAGLTFDRVIYLDPDQNGFRESNIARMKELKRKRDCGVITQGAFKRAYSTLQVARFDSIIKTAATLVHEYQGHYEQPILMSQRKAEPPAYRAEAEFLKRVGQRFSGNRALTKVVNSILSDAQRDATNY
jgi:hypothetical protein